MTTLSLQSFALPFAAGFSLASRWTARVGEMLSSHRAAKTTRQLTCVGCATALVMLAGCGTTGNLVWNNGFGPQGPVAAEPTFSPAAGSYSAPITVTISDTTPGATIYYTTDGTAPMASEASSGMSGVTPAEHSAGRTVRTAFVPDNGNSVQVEVGANETLQAMAVLPGDTNSAIASAAYAIGGLGATAVDTCKGGVLSAGSIDTDLQIHGTSCVVDGKVPNGQYVFRNVNIWGGGTLTFADAKIDFHAHSILVENGGTLQAGSPSTPVVGPITIWLYGSADDGIPPITCKSSPTCGVPEDIWNSNTNVVTKTKPTPGTSCKPASDYGPAPVFLGPTGCFYQYDPLDPGAPDNAYFSRKTLALSYGGTIYLRGAKGIRPGPIDANPADSGTSWVRLTTTLKGGEMSFNVDRPVPTWGKGDHIVVTSTDYLPGHSEELVIQSVQSNTVEGVTTTTITLQSPVKYPHNGATYDYSSLPASQGPEDDPNRPATLPSRHLETRAAVALLTRSIMIASEGEEPILSDRSVDHFPATPGNYYGGQTIMRDGFKTYQVQGIEFYDLGQGGAIGRYPVHFHMDRLVPQPTADFDGTYIADSSIHDSMTRFITIHATQGLLVARNVGFRSIGHGFYLEDSTETNNRLYSNIGIEARAAVDDPMNPRLVPGILARPDPAGDVFPFHSDYDHPTIFWLTNGWNDLRYNVAVGAGTCGACYWLVPSVISGPSVYETWTSYASMQTNGRGGIAPLKNFVGNSCSTAMTSLQTVDKTGLCQGVVAWNGPTGNTLRAIQNTNAAAEDPNRYPNTQDGRAKATVCPPADQGDCSKVPPCTGFGPSEANCAVTVIDHYTTSFNWAPKNFSAVWLRGWWYLLRDSAITDVQGGGLTMVSGGGYTRSDAAQGFWNLSQRTLFVGNTQPIDSSTGVPANPAASNAGPFNPYTKDTLPCPFTGAPYCLSPNDDATYETDTFGNAQRMISIYDGPASEDSDAFMDVHVTDIGTLGDCKPGGNSNPGSCFSLGWMNGYQSGAVQVPPGNNPTNHCVLPNAAIAWKQPNGFYYPPVFNSVNLGFNNVDIRHYVVQPLWEAGSFKPDLSTVANTYCTWQPGDFNNFTDIDRATELSDDDGGLTGLIGLVRSPVGPTQPEPSVSVNKDPFYNAPLVTPECASGAPGAAATVDTSPYQYLTTVVYPACAANLTAGNPEPCGTNWGMDCGNQGCYGVPLYRQFLTNAEYTAWQANPNPAYRPSDRMMGQGNGQRSAMTLNHGSYYIDTSLSAADQISTGNIPVTSKNVFIAGQHYYVFLIYATAQTKQTYSLYIGKGLSQADAMKTVVPGRIQTPSNQFTFKASGAPGPGSWIPTAPTYDSETGLLTVSIDLSDQSQTFTDDRPKFCRPQTYCSIQDDGSCGCAPGSNCTDNSVCSWGTKDIDCPIDGCFGFQLTMPAGFVAGKQADLPPAPIHFVGDPGSDPYFIKGNVQFYNVDSSISGAQCHYDTPPVQQN